MVVYGLAAWTCMDLYGLVYGLVVYGLLVFGLVVYVWSCVVWTCMVYGHAWCMD